MNRTHPLDKAAVLRAWDAYGYGHGQTIAIIFGISASRVSQIVRERDFSREEMPRRAKGRKPCPAALAPVRRGRPPRIDRQALLTAYLALAEAPDGVARVARQFDCTPVRVSQIVWETYGQTPRQRRAGLNP